MGLAERRATNDFQAHQYPQLAETIHEIAGFAVPIEVAWEEIAAEGQSDQYKDAWTEIFFKPVIEALRQVTRDQMGKDAVKAGLKKIQLRNSKGAYSPASAISFDGGILVIDHELSNAGDTQDRIKYLVESLEKKL